MARIIAEREGLRHVEVDCLLWQEEWRLTPTVVYEGQHAEIIDGDNWVMDGLGQRASIPSRLTRATQIILIDMPLWMHFWLAAERQIAWASGQLEHTPGGISQMPPTQALFRAIWDVEQTWMPEIRAMCAKAETRGASVTRLPSVDELNAFTDSMGWRTR